MTAHRHRWIVTRRVRASQQPFVRECACGTVQRHHRGRWVLAASRRAGRRP